MKTGRQVVYAQPSDKLKAEVIAVREGYPYGPLEVRLSSLCPPGMMYIISEDFPFEEKMAQAEDRHGEHDGLRTDWPR